MKSPGRSMVTNGRALLPNLEDGRSAAGRRHRDLFEIFIGNAGPRPTEAVIQLCKRAAGLATVLEVTEAQFINTGKIDVEAYCKAVSAFIRTCNQADIIKRRDRDNGKHIDLQQYLSHYVDRRRQLAAGAGGDDDDDDDG